MIYLETLKTWSVAQLHLISSFLYLTLLLITEKNMEIQTQIISWTPTVCIILKPLEGKHDRLSFTSPAYIRNFLTISIFCHSIVGQLLHLTMHSFGLQIERFQVFRKIRKAKVLVNPTPPPHQGFPEKYIEPYGRRSLAPFSAFMYP